MRRPPRGGCANVGPQHQQPGERCADVSPQDQAPKGQAAQPHGACAEVGRAAHGATAPSSRHDGGTSCRGRQTGPGRRRPGARRHGARGARVRAGREGSRASGRQREVGRGARAAAAPRAPATRGHGADTGRPTRPAMGRHRPGAGTATNRPRRTGRKQGRATISAEPGRSSWPPSAPTRSRVAPWRATRRRHGGSAPRPPPANRARTASPGRRASRAIAAQANTRTGTAKRSRAKGSALPKERAGRRGGS